MRNEQFRRKLQRELISRVEKNAKFSARAFAKQLEVEPSSFIQILNGKRNLTDKMCIRLGSKLGLPPKELSQLMGVKQEDREGKAFKSFSNISMDTFHVMADWYHYAILELTALDHFQPELKWISKVLGITVHEARDAVERLVRLDFLLINGDSWVDNLGNVNNFGNEFTAPAAKKLQKQILEKAIYALENVPYEDRVQSSMTMPVSKKKLKAAKEKILHFIDELDSFLKEDENLDDIYNISFSLYPISFTKENKK